MSTIAAVRKPGYFFESLQTFIVACNNGGNETMVGVDRAVDSALVMRRGKRWTAWRIAGVVIAVVGGAAVGVGATYLLLGTILYLVYRYWWTPVYGRARYRIEAGVGEPIVTFPPSPTVARRL